MKKTYMTPEMEVVNIEAEVLMLTVSGNTEADADTEQNASDRRGTWGNLWN